MFEERKRIQKNAWNMVYRSLQKFEEGEWTTAGNLLYLHEIPLSLRKIEKILQKMLKEGIVVLKCKKRVKFYQLNSVN